MTSPDLRAVFGFEDGVVADGVPAGWFRCGHDGFTLTVDPDEGRSGTASGCVRATGEARYEDFGGLGRDVDATPYRGRRARLTGWLRTDSVIGPGAGLWMRVDLPDGESILDNMSYPVQRAVTGTSDWAQYEIVIDVPGDAVLVAFGFILVGTGTVWGDDLVLDAADPPATRVGSIDLSSLTPSHATRRFYGRDAQVARFRELVDRARHGRGDVNVMLVHGIGGIGKTTLLNRLREVVGPDTTTVSLDWADVRQRKPTAFPVDPDPSLWLTVADELERAFDGSARSFKPLRQVWKNLHRAATKADEVLGRAESDSGTGRRKLGFPGAAVEAGGGVAQVVETFAGLPTGVGVTASAVGAVLSAVAASSGRRDRLRAGLTTSDFRLLDDAFVRVADVFAGCLRRAADREPLVVLLDTYEIVKSAGPWLRRLIRASGPRVVWVVAGRFDLGGVPEPADVRAFREALPGTAVTRLPAFDEPTVDELFRTTAPDRPLDPGQLSQLVDATDGIPLAVWLAAELWGSGAPLEAITSGGAAGRVIADALVDRLLVHQGGSESDLSRIHRLALLRDSDDVALLAALWESEHVAADLADLARRYDFIFAGGHRLHDSVRDAVQVHLLGHVQRESVRESNAAAVSVLEQRLRRRDDILDTMERRLADERWVSDFLALVWHRHWVDPRTGLDTVLTILPTAVVHNTAVVRSSLDLADYFADLFTAAERRLLRALRSVTLGASTGWTKPTAVRALADLERHRRRDGFEPDDGCAVETATALALLRARVTRSADDYDRLASIARRLPPQATRLRVHTARTLLPHAKQRVTESYRSTPDDITELPDLVCALDPDNPDAHRNRGEALYLLKRNEDALAAFTRYAALAPNSWDAFACIAQVQGLLGDEPGALRAADRAIALSTDAVEARRIKAVALKDLGRSPEDVPDPLDRALLYEKLGKLEESLSACRSAVELHPRPEVHVLHAELALANGVPREALVAANLALRDDADNRQALSARARASSRIGDEAALVDFRRLRDHDPDDHWLSYEHGLAFGSLGKTAEAIRAYFDVVAAVPEDEYAHYVLQLALYWCERPDLIDGLADLPARIDRTRNGRDIGSMHQAKGIALYALGRYEEALGCFDLAKRSDPDDDANLHAHIALALRELGRSAEALSACRRAADVGPADPSTLIRLGEQLMVAGDHDAAARNALAAIELEGESGLESRVLAGVVAWRTDDVALAREHFQRALDTGQEGRGSVNPVLAAELRAIASTALGRPDRAAAELLPHPPHRRIVKVPDSWYEALAAAPTPLEGLDDVRSALDPT